jgi:hypothetical protein
MVMNAHKDLIAFIDSINFRLTFKKVAQDESQ